MSSSERKVKALLEACQFCADPAHQDEVRKILAQPEYLAMDRDYIYLRDSQQIACGAHSNLNYYIDVALDREHLRIKAFYTS